VHEVIVLGASAGGVQALRTVVAGLPADLPVPVFIVLHVPRVGPHALPAILARAGPLPAVDAEDGAMARGGVIYVAPPDHHLLVTPDGMRLSKDPPNNGHRPAVDPLFRSAAAAFGPGVVAVVLSGAGSDGAAGLVEVAAAGGIAVVQDPAEAQHPSMPERALELVPSALIRPVDSIGEVVGRLVRGGEGLRAAGDGPAA